MEWISVDFAKPLKYQYVLFVSVDNHKYGSVCGGQYLEDEGWTDYFVPDSYGDPITHRNVTHWMPLPEPPAVEARAVQEAK